MIYLQRLGSKNFRFLLHLGGAKLRGKNDPCSFSGLRHASYGRKAYALNVHLVHMLPCFNLLFGHLYTCLYIYCTAQSNQVPVCLIIDDTYTHRAVQDGSGCDNMEHRADVRCMSLQTDNTECQVITMRYPDYVMLVLTSGRGGVVMLDNEI